MSGALAYGFDEHGDRDQLCRSGVEKYFRWGYQVAGAKPRYMGSVKTRAQATALALGQARVVHETLREVGAPDVVSFWVQQETLINTVDHDEPDIEPLTASMAAIR